VPLFVARLAGTDADFSNGALRWSALSQKMGDCVTSGAVPRRDGRRGGRAGGLRGRRGARRLGEGRGGERARRLGGGHGSAERARRLRSTRIGSRSGLTFLPPPTVTTWLLSSCERVFFRRTRARGPLSLSLSLGTLRRRTSPRALTLVTATATTARAHEGAAVARGCVFFGLLGRISRLANGVVESGRRLSLSLYIYVEPNERERECVCMQVARWRAETVGEAEAAEPEPERPWASAAASACWARTCLERVRKGVQKLFRRKSTRTRRQRPTLDTRRGVA
jgi:hypothetical protein